MFALADCNNFYVSCERAFNPSLNLRPVVVLSNNDGCIISRSNEAKSLGIKMGAPLFQTQDLVDEHHVKVLSSNYALYGDMSRRVMNYLASQVNNVEIYSIDECFLDFSDILSKDLHAQHLRGEVLKRTHIPICVGVAPTKTLAKLANRIAKKDQNSKGVYLLDTCLKIKQALSVTEVGDVWGIGRQYAKRLNSSGINFASQLVDKSDAWVAKNLGGVVGLRLVLELRGISVLKLEQSEDSSKVKDSIATSRSFGQPVREIDGLLSALLTFTFRACEKLRHQGSLASEVVFFLSKSRFKDHDGPHSFSRAVQLSHASSDTLEIASLAKDALLSFELNHQEFSKAGVILNKFSKPSSVQLGLFSTMNQESRGTRTQLMKIIDLLNEKYGRETIRLASMLPRKDETCNSWVSKQDFMTQRYTTVFSELPNVS